MSQVGHMQLRKVNHNVIKEVGKTSPFVIKKKLEPETGSISSNPILSNTHFIYSHFVSSCLHVPCKLWRL